EVEGIAAIEAQVANTIDVHVVARCKAANRRTVPHPLHFTRIQRNAWDIAQGVIECHDVAVFQHCLAQHDDALRQVAQRHRELAGHRALLHQVFLAQGVRDDDLSDIGLRENGGTAQQTRSGSGNAQRGADAAMQCSESGINSFFYHFLLPFTQKKLAMAPTDARSASSAGAPSSHGKPLWVSHSSWST